MSEENPSQRQSSETSTDEFATSEKELEGDNKPGEDNEVEREGAEEGEREGKKEGEDEEEEIAEEELEKLTDDQIREILQGNDEILSERDSRVTIGGTVYVEGDFTIEGPAYFDETHHTTEQKSIIKRLISWVKGLFGL